MLSFGQKITIARIINRHRQGELANIVGIAQTTLAKVEHDKLECPKKFIATLNEYVDNAFLML